MNNVMTDSNIRTAVAAWLAVTPPPPRRYTAPHFDVGDQHKVTTMEFIFEDASAFDQPILQRRHCRVRTSARGIPLYVSSTSFTQMIEDMYGMFEDALEPG